MNKMPRPLLAMLIVMTISLIVSVAVAVFSISRLFYQPITYSFALYGPLRVYRVCPGETMSIPIQGRIEHAPAVITTLETWWSVDNEITVVRDSAPQYSLVTAPSDISRTLSIKVPLLPAGNYEYRRSSEDDGSPPAIISVSTIIRSDCQ